MSTDRLQRDIARAEPRRPRLPVVHHDAPACPECGGLDLRARSSREVEGERHQTTDCRACGTRFRLVWLVPF